MLSLNPLRRPASAACMSRGMRLWDQARQTSPGGWRRRPGLGGVGNLQLRPSKCRLRSHCLVQPENMPQGLQLQAVPDDALRDVEYDAADNVVRIPLSALSDQRRTKLVMFTCNKCGGRTARLVNPIAWQKGLVICQCQNCGVWHTLAANNPSIYEEIVYERDGDGNSSNPVSSSEQSSVDVAWLPQPMQADDNADGGT